MVFESARMYRVSPAEAAHLPSAARWINEVAK
jgi:hypothetical protein